MVLIRGRKQFDNGAKHRMLYFPVNSLEMEGIELPEFPHITLLYLGEVMEGENPEVTIHYLEALAELSSLGTIEAKVNGVARFCEKDEEGKTPFVLLVDSKDMLDFHISAEQQFGNTYSDHGFTPHITLSYLGEEESMPFDMADPASIGISAVCYAEGDNTWCYTLQDYIPEEDPQLWY